MHVRELVELGALVASHGTRFLQRENLLIEGHLDQYWVSSRCRQNRWAESLKQFSRVPTSDAEQNWRSIRPVIEEVIASELLTRIWAAVSCAHDQRFGSTEFSPIARGVLVGHMEVRNRALNAMVYGRGFTVEEGVELNRLRRHTERWTDMLIGFLIASYQVAEFAFQPQRAADFADDLGHEGRSVGAHSTWQLTLASLRSSFYRRLTLPSPNEPLNRKIAASILACFHSELFDSLGLFKSLWVVRLDQTAADTDELIQQLLQLEAMPAQHGAARRFR